MTDIFSLIKEKVSLYKLLDQVGVKYPSKEINAKVRCPFHGLDKRASAFIYHDTNTFRCFVCSRSWDVIDFWAEANQWYKTKDGEEVLDVARSIKDLSTTYEIEFKEPEWQDKFRELTQEFKGPAQGYEGFPLQDREKMVSFEGWQYSKRLAQIEDRSLLYEKVSLAWDTLDSLDITGAGWWSSLQAWKQSSLSILEKNHEQETDPRNPLE